MTGNTASALAASDATPCVGNRPATPAVLATRGRPQRRLQRAWVAMAIVALALGALFYAVVRPHAAAFLPAGWHRPVLVGAWPSLASGLIGAAPTFLHALAMSLLIVVATQAATPRGRGWCCAAVCVVEFAFEVAQHAVVAAALLGSVSASSMAGGIVGALHSYLSHGTFDPLDLVAACAGCLAAFTVVAHSSRGRRTSPGARHVAA